MGQLMMLQMAKYLPPRWAGSPLKPSKNAADEVLTERRDRRTHLHQQNAPGSPPRSGEDVPGQYARSAWLSSSLAIELPWERACERCGSVQ
jgi:hypothetical protein